MPPRRQTFPTGYTTSAQIQRGLGYTPSRVKPGAGGMVTAYGGPSGVYLDLTPGPNTGTTLFFNASTGLWEFLEGVPGMLMTTDGSGTPTWTTPPVIPPMPTFGSGPPSTLIAQGAVYYDTLTAAPLYTQYVQNSGAWNQVA